MSTNSTDFARLVTGFLTEYLPLQRCYSRNTVLSYRDTLKLFLRFLDEAKNIPLGSFYMKGFSRGLVIEFLEWYRQGGASISAANQRLAAIKTFAGYAQFESIECIAPLQEVSGIKAKKSNPEGSPLPDSHAGVGPYKPPGYPLTYRVPPSGAPYAAV